MTRRRWLELFALFGAFPLGLAVFLQNPQHWMIPLLCCTGLVCLYALLCDPHFKRFRLWHVEGFGQALKQQLRLFVPLASLITLLVYWWLPDVLFALPVNAFEFWLYTLAVYPLVSVLPQELIFRTFFFHRYKGILPSKRSRIGVSTLSFSLAHGIYGNWIAVIVSMVGGALFGVRYAQTRSTLQVAIEHSLWGSFLFTVGVGLYLLHADELPAGLAYLVQ